MAGDLLDDLQDDDQRPRPGIGRIGPTPTPLAIRGIQPQAPPEGQAASSASTMEEPPALPASLTSSAPAMTAPTPKIPSSPEQQHMEGDLRQQQNLDKGSGISQLQRSHPVAGGILRGLNVAARIGTAAFPAAFPVLQQIPGTEEHHNMLVGGNRGALNSDIAQQEHEATTARTQAETGAVPSTIAKNEAEAAKAQADAAAANQPKAKEEKWSEFAGFTDTDGTPLIREENSGQVVRANDKKPPTGFKASKPEQPFQTDKVVRVVNGVPHEIVYDKQTGADVRDEGPTKIPSTGANDNRSDRSYGLQSKRLDDTRKPIEQIQQRVGRLNDTLSQQSPQADALVAPELLSIMSGGQGSGLRMNEAEISRILGGRSAWENLKAAAQHWSLKPEDARSITPDQDKQIRALVGAVQKKLNDKQAILDSADEALLNTDDVKQHRQIVADTKKKMDAIDAGTVQQQGGGGNSSGKAVSLAAARSLPQNKGKSDDEIRKDIETHGHKVTD